MLAQAWCLVLRLVGLEQSQCYWQPRIGQQTAMKLNQVQLNCMGVVIVCALVFVSEIDPPLHPFNMQQLLSSQL